MLIVGEKDIEDGTVSVRLRTDEDMGAISLIVFSTHVRNLIEKRSLELQ
jgi:threonyl-tRNA synthetase